MNYFSCMPFKKIVLSDIEYFISVTDKTRVLTDTESLYHAASDETEDLLYHPEVVIQPVSTQEVSSILAYCNSNNFPVTPRGAGTGLSGGALPMYGGVVIDTCRMNKIINIDTANFQVMTEPGVITQVLQEEVIKQGLFYPPDPASKGSCFIGGNVAENSGGPRAVKYGTVKDYVLNLEVVLPNGDIMWTGANVLKNATGYNLTQLITGSEGTLCIITKIVLRLIPVVRHDILLLISFRSAIAACEAVNTIMMSGITPSALEFMERDALEWAIRFTGSDSVHLPEDIAAHLLIELDGNEQGIIYEQAEIVTRLLSGYDIGEVLVADNEAQKNALWLLRRKVGEAVKSNSVYKEEDTVVPRAKLPQLLAKVKELGIAYGFQSVCYGHAGDGNLHVNIIKGAMSDDDWNNRLPIAIRELFIATVNMGGTISGEHGIGLVQRNYMDIAFNTVQLKLMKSIKDLFDPKGILNPGKIFQKDL